ncbi:uncharacterized protein CC84DRAFT_1166579 [Paraphaeosphaeria sporulosa]|uniref:RNA polymerase III RPC4-domain-containing protein n=1 Tax=Paraphaeosphaeria sporulosa TaxID=1460663 RepID=A0A177C7D8_9PLEO|nr:uncharacterized protein CC84DRAFT_1166579 [Paraphaeosphaeria sporulosa]OAG02772.1 hypothetical protein CC84DRAFT_1166579 [Paraphaeosphaeria sporulosa]
MSSDDDDEQNAEFPRKNIDFIELSSDEGEAEPVPRSHGHLPIRIGRKPHKEKLFGINTDASTEANAPQNAEVSGPSTETSHKGKGKAKEVEVTGESKSYKGMWQDSDGTDGEVKVKPEPISSDDEGAAREQVGIAAPIKNEHSPERERKPKVPSDTAIPSFQTDEERQEWERIQYNLIGMRKELGPGDDAMQPDVEGDVAMIDAAANASKPSVRDDHTYLFQLPPIMPELLLPGNHSKIKQEPPTDAAAATAPGQPPTTIKKEPTAAAEDFSDPRASSGTGARFASGRVGKMRVHASGRTTLDWGGTSYEIGPGNPSSFLQEVVSLEVVPEERRVVPEDAGEAYSYGRIKEKFVVVPDFGALLGG